MTQDTRIQFNVSDFFRHGAAIILFCVCWIFLSQWYLYRSNNDYLFFAVLFVLAVLLASYKRIRFLLPRISGKHLVILIGIIFLSLPWSEWMRQNPPASREDWSRQIFLQSIILYGLFLLFHFVPSIPRTLARFANEFLEYVQSKDYLLFLPSILFFLITAFISVFVYKKTLLVQDSAAHLFQAKIFSEWKLYAPVPPVSDFFSCVGDMLVMKDGRWFSMYTPGFPLLLAVAMFLHSEWILSPLLGALTVGIWISYAARWHGRRVAAVLGVLCLFSPFLLVMSSTIMVHTPELFIASASLYLCRLEMEQPGPGKKTALFFLMIFAILTRLFSLTAFLAPVLAYTCWLRIKAKDWTFPLIIAAGLCTGAVILAIYQWKTTGNPLLSGYFLEYKDLKLGFGSNFGGRVHTPLRGLENVSNNFLGINSWLTGWYAGALFFVGAFLISRTRFQTWDRVLLLSSFLVVSFYFFYVIQALIFGPRSYFVLAPFLLLLIARSCEREPETGDWFDQKTILALLVVALVSFFPKRLPEFVTRYFPDRLQAGDLKKELHRVDQSKTLVFLEEIGPQYVDWNDPFLRNTAILCKNLKTRNSEAISAFPGYQPMYFRMNVTFGKAMFDSGYKLQDKPTDKRPGYLSLFQLALAVETDKYPDKDFYDVCYEGFFNENNAAEQLEYLRDESKKEVKENFYKRNFRMAIISVGRLLLLPKAAFEKDDQNWEKTLNLEQVRKVFQNAIQYSKASGEVGKAISIELEKVRRRIDQDHNGQLSDQELLNFLNEKIQILKLA